MNGLEIIDEKTPGFTDKLLRREPKENAYVEINNMIASAPLEQIARDDIDRVLAQHGISQAGARSRLMFIYSQVLRYFVRDFQLTDEELLGLGGLQEAFSMSQADAGYIHTSVIYPIFQNAVRNALFDNKVTDEEEAWLRQVANKLRIPGQFVEEVYAAAMKPLVEARLKIMLADGRLSPEEDRELADLSKHFNLNIKVDPPTQAVLDRARFLWQLGNGYLPRTNVPIYLKKDEFCAIYLSASRREMREETTTRSEYSEKPGLIRDIWGRQVTYGKMETEHRTHEVMRTIDSGILYFTNQRMLFNGERGNFEDDLREIVGAVFNPGGMRIERNNGPDRLLDFVGDAEALQLIFENLMKTARR
jgi:hypothetical protein